jgi:membrane associated rhomboid family serine protease
MHVRSRAYEIAKIRQVINTMDINLNPGDYEIGAAKEKNRKGKLNKIRNIFNNKSLIVIIILVNALMYFISVPISNYDTRLIKSANYLNSLNITITGNTGERILRFSPETVFTYAYASSFPPVIKQEGAYYRIISATYHHGGLLHLVINMFSLFIIGRFVEQIYGKFRFFVIYTVAGIASTLLSFFARSSFTLIASVGASGSLFGLVGALLSFALIYKNKLDPVYRKNLLSNLVFIIGINLLIGFSVSGIDNYGHIGGLVGGLIAGYFIAPIIFVERKKEKSYMKVISFATALLVAGCIFTNYLFYFNGKAIKDVENVFRKRSSVSSSIPQRREGQGTEASPGQNGETI